MSGLRFTGLIALCALLAACSDRATNREMTAPDAAPALNVVPADGGVIDLATGEAVVLSDEVGAAQAATGGRASGHADITFFGIDEQYSFVALSTDPAPTAKGQFEGRIQTPTDEIRIHATMDCLRTVGNQAWASGPVTQLVVNGQRVPTTVHVLYRVMDNGEGKNSPPDLASPLFAAFPQSCAFLFTLPLFPSEDGNIQVRPT